MYFWTSLINFSDHFLSAPTSYCYYFFYNFFRPYIFIYIYIYIIIFLFFIFIFCVGTQKWVTTTIMLLFPITWEQLCCCFQMQGNHYVVVSNFMETLVLLLPIVWKLLCCFKLLENHCVVVSNWMKTIRVACLFVWRPLCVSKRKETVVHNFIMRWRPM